MALAPLSGQGISLDEFKARLPIAEVVGRHVKLVRRGRELTGLCPFHSEKTPSFTVAEAKGFFHCFGCGRHGNAIDFVMALEGLEFGEAVARLAELTGLPAPGGRPAPRVDRSLLEANEAAARWFAGRLEGADGAPARTYLDRRGLGANTILTFGLGYAPDGRTALGQALQREGFGEDRLVAAGLLIRPDDGRPAYDRFRDRIMFPIYDQRARLVGFGGRALGDARAKYLNSPETELFHKGELLYGYGHAQAMVRREGAVIAVEGYMDVLALAQAGIGHVVAPLGTAITESQLAWLWRLADAPLICLDGDAAGLRAAHRLVERALPMLRPGQSLRFVLLPGGEDPDSLIRRHGREAMTARLRDSIHFLDFLWRAETAGVDLRAPERRAALDRRLRELARTVADPDVRRRFAEAMFKRQRAIDGGPGRRRPGRSPDGDRRGAANAGRASGVGAARLLASLERERERREGELVTPILVQPAILQEIEEEFTCLDLEHLELEQLRECIMAWYGAARDLDPGALSDHLNRTGFADLVGRLVRGRGQLGMRAGTERGEKGDVLELWRARAAQHRQFAERRALAAAMAEAIAGADEHEQRARLLAVRRLIEARGDASGRDDDDA